MIQYLFLISLTIPGFTEIYGTGEMEAKLGQFPYLASIWYFNTYRCSGSIINEKHILTTASCVQFVSSFDSAVMVGSVQSTWNDPRGQKFQVDHIHMHYRLRTNYRMHHAGIFKNDIAVLRLVRNIIFNPVVRAIPFVSEVDINLRGCMAPGFYSSISAWNSIRMIMKWSPAIIISNEQCESNDLLPDEYCAQVESSHTNKMGSPIICDDVAVGMITRSGGVNKKIFLSLLPYVDFIDYVTDTSKEDVQCSENLPIVSIWDKGNYACGGILFTPYHILTASHCVWNVTRIHLRAVVQSTQILLRNKAIEWLLIEQKHINPCYEDIAILMIKPIPGWDKDIDLIFPETIQTLIPLRSCYGFRWHRAYNVEGEPLMQFVRTVEIILSNEECRSLGVVLKKDRFCTRSSYIRADYNSKSIGNPIVCDGWIMGIMIPTVSKSPPPLDVSTFIMIANHQEYLMNFVNSYVHSFSPDE